MTPEEKKLIDGLCAQRLGFRNEHRKYCCYKDRFGGVQ